MVSTFIWLSADPDRPRAYHACRESCRRNRKNENVGSALERGEAAVAQRPVAARRVIAVNPQLMQSLVDCDNPGGAPGQLLSRLAPRMPILAASQVRSPKDLMWLKIRLNPNAGLIDVAVGKNVGLRDRHVAAVVGDVLGAGESAGLGKSRRTAGNERHCLIVAEAGEDRVLAEKL